MAGNFLERSRHGTQYYFRRRVPQALRAVIGKPFLVHSLHTTDRRTAVSRARSFAAQTDAIFEQSMTALKKHRGDGLRIEYSLKLDLNELGRPIAITVDATPDEQEAVNSAIRTAVEAAQGAKPTPRPPSSASASKTFEDAIGEYYATAQIKPQTKATYRSKLEHARKFFGGTTNVFDVRQSDLVRYCIHVRNTVPNITSQGLYISTVASFMNWHRCQQNDLPQLTTKTLIPKKETPDSEDRDAFTLDQLRIVFRNASRYRSICPHKFWASIAPAFMGCRIEELCQVHLATDLTHDEDANIWYFDFNGRPDPDGIKRKSMKKLASWRCMPIHSALVRHGFVEFLQDQKRAGFTRPFEQEWQPRKVDKADVGPIVKWSHYISRWGGRELEELGTTHQFGTNKLAYFHSMRHTFKREIGNAGVPSEISEALSGRKHGGADAERYAKLKQNHRRLAREGIEQGLVQLVALLDEALGS
jgi:hypothetical protein